MKNNLILSTLIFIISFFIKEDVIYLSVVLLNYLIISFPIFMKIGKERKFFDENTLMIIASISALILGEYKEALAILILFQFGEYLSDYIVSKSKEKVINLTKLKSDYINLKKENKIIKEKIENAKIGDVFVVKKGELVPLDGVVIDGESTLDLSSLTGESEPKKIKKGDKILSSSINTGNMLTIKSTSDSYTSTTSKIITLLESEEKSKTEKFVTKFAKIYTPIIVLISALITFIPFLLGENIDDYIYKSLIFLVTSCPCALVISVPLTYFCAIGKASKEGILIKGSTALEKVKNINVWAVDKTGTLTKGNFVITKIESKEKDFLKYLKYAEYYSNHPLTKAISKKNIDIKQISNFEEISGYGVRAKVFNKNILVGNYEFLRKNDVKLKQEKDATIYMSIDGNYVGYAIIGDEIKENAFKLKQNLVILSGDEKEKVKNVAQKLNITNYYSNLLPVDKVNKVKELQKENKVAFIGDGINDAPVIKISDLGISMGNSGSDIAIESSDIVFMKDDISKIETLIKISKKTSNILMFNIVFSLSIKFLFMFLALLGKTSIWGAVFADVGVTILCILNSLRTLEKN